MATRLSLPNAMMAVAQTISRRSTCPRMACGAVVVEDGHIVSTGYNGALSGLPHCTEVGCQMEMVRERERCTRIIHAEFNAVLRARGRGDTIYTTGQPCFECTKAIWAVGIRNIVYVQDYPDDRRDELWNVLTGLSPIALSPNNLNIFQLEPLLDFVIRECESNDDYHDF